MSSGVSMTPSWPSWVPDLRFGYSDQYLGPPKPLPPHLLRRVSYTRNLELKVPGLQLGKVTRDIIQENPLRHGFPSGSPSMDALDFLELDESFKAYITKPKKAEAFSRSLSLSLSGLYQDLFGVSATNFLAKGDLVCVFLDVSS